MRIKELGPGLCRDDKIVMRIIADLHIHSRFSRACSRDLTLENIAAACAVKGVNVVGAGDFTHPEWFAEMKEKLIEKEPGLYVLKLPLPNPPLIKGRSFATRFILSAEISCIYTKGGKVRRLHIVILAPSLETVEKINLALSKIGNLKSDGRPILGLDAEKLAEIVFGIDERCVIIPAHIWTPWFAMFGSKSGFNSREECWSKYATPSSDGASKIFAIETGLSSDPQMNWRVKNLDNVSIISNSDAHSLPNIGREANVFEIDENKLSYDEIICLIKEKNPLNFLYTIEFYPEEGMYHLDGHRLCGVCLQPEESERQKNICPVCKKELTIGVLNRVAELAANERPENFVDNSRVPFKKLIELDKIIAESLGVKSRSAKQVQMVYQNLIASFGTELNILLEVSAEDLKKVVEPIMAEGILRARAGQVKIKPGFDGQYGEIKIFNEEERGSFQKKLF
jgi:uncharacterized protein (TIGR00375 family)